jgi:hypothetical protein
MIADNGDLDRVKPRYLDHLVDQVLDRNQFLSAEGTVGGLKGNIVMCARPGIESSTRSEGTKDWILPELLCGRYLVGTHLQIKTHHKILIFRLEKALDLFFRDYGRRVEALSSLGGRSARSSCLLIP